MTVFLYYCIYRECSDGAYYYDGLIYPIRNLHLKKSDNYIAAPLRLGWVDLYNLYRYRFTEVSKVEIDLEKY